MHTARLSTREAKSAPTFGFTSVVFVVDDDISVREAIEPLIHGAGWGAETFGTAEAFLAHERPSTPSCVILDVTLPDLNGFDLQERIGADGADMQPVIFITGYGDVPMSVRAMKAGAVDFLTKPFGDDALLNAVEEALERSRSALAMEAKLQVLLACYELLSGREREVMSLVVSGLLNKQVAGELGISEVTVKAHRGKVMRKMQADSLPELVNMAARLDVSSAPKR